MLDESESFRSANEPIEEILDRLPTEVLEVIFKILQIQERENP